MNLKIATAAIVVSAVAGCVTPGAKAEYEDISGKMRGVNEQKMDAAACLKDLADHRSASNLVDAVDYIKICMQSKGWRISGWRKPDGSLADSPFV